MNVSSLPLLTSAPQVQSMVELMQPAPVTGTRQLSDALRAGHEMTQKGLGTLMKSMDHSNLNMSEGERSALQMHVSQFHALVTLAMNVSLGIGKACEKLQQG